MAQKISELKTYKTVNRRDRNGNYKAMEFEFKYTPNVKSFNFRLLSKLLDLLLYCGIVYVLAKFFTFTYPHILIATLGLFTINPVLETLTGKTFGKLLIGFEVVDDHCKKPSVLKSFTKNTLQLLNLVIYVFTEGVIWEEDIYFHNTITNTYTIKSKNKKEIIAMMNKA